VLAFALLHQYSVGYGSQLVSLSAFDLLKVDFSLPVFRPRYVSGTCVTSRSDSSRVSIER